MRGHIRKRGQNSWAIVIDLPRDPQTGKRRQQWHSVRGSKRDAERVLRELLVDVEKGTYVKSPRTLTLGEYLTEWLESHAELHCRPRTAEGYRFIANHYLIPAFGRMRLSELRPHHVAGYCSNGVRQGLSNRTVLHQFRLLHKALKDSVKLGLIAVNPCDGVDSPKPEDKEMKFLCSEEVDKFLRVAREAPWPYYYLFYTKLFTGLRRSELLGLTWGNLELELCALSVTQTLHKLSGAKYLI